MSSDALAVIKPTISEVKELARDLSGSALLPVALRKSPADVLLIILTGQELGLGPMQSIRGIHIIEGKPSMSADLMAALCLSSPNCERIKLVESTATKATYEAKRKGEGPTVLSFTAEQAKTAGLLGKGNWAKYPEAMLRARCLSAICRAVFPDCVAGVYDSDSAELGPVREHRAPPATVTPIRPESVDAEWTAEPDAVVSALSPEALAWIAEAATTADLTALMPRIQQSLGGKPNPEVRAAYVARMAELKVTP